MKHDEHESDPLSDDARALFAAGARERAPEQLRAALLAQAARRSELGSARRQRRWPWALGVAAGVAAAIGLREAWRVAPLPEEPLISAERGRERVPSLPEAPLLPPAPVPALSPRPATPPTTELKRTAPRRNRAAPEAPTTREESAASVESPAAAPASLAPAPADLSQQLGLLQSVRKALRSGEQRRALELLDTDAELERGNFAAEARLMRIEALDGTGRQREAAALAREFARLYPHSPLVDRARRFAGGGAR